MQIKSKFYYTDNLKLALPIILSNIGQAMVMLVDNIMVGRLGNLPLAASAFAGMLVMNILVVAIGFSIGLTPLVAKNYVLGRHGLCAKLFQNSLIINSFISIILVMFLLALLPFLGYMGQDQSVVTLAKPYYTIITLSIIPYMWFLSFKQFFEGLGNTSAAMVISIICNLLNVLLNYAFIYGHFGAPELGVFGAGLATFISRLSMPFIFWAYASRSRFNSFLKMFEWKNFSMKLHKKLFFYGYPISLQMVIEYFALSAVALITGWIGVKELAANQIAFSVISIMYLIVTGIASATTILVSFEMGRRDTEKIRNYAISATHLAILFMSVSALTIITFGSAIASVFTTDPEVVSLAAAMMLVIGFVQIFDGVQVVYLGALRGINDVKAPMYFALLLYGFICVPSAYIFGITFNLGVQGVWAGFGVGLLAASLLYSTRFFSRSKKLFGNHSK